MNEVCTIDLADKHCKTAWPECAGTTHCRLTESFDCNAKVSSLLEKTELVKWFVA